MAVRIPIDSGLASTSILVEAAINKISRNLASHDWTGNVDLRRLALREQIDDIMVKLSLLLILASYVVDVCSGGLKWPGGGRARRGSELPRYYLLMMYYRPRKEKHGRTEYYLPDHWQWRRCLRSLPDRKYRRSRIYCRMDTLPIVFVVFTIYR